MTAHCCLYMHITWTGQMGNFQAYSIQFPPWSSEDHLFLDLKKLFASQSLRSDHETKYVVHDSMKGLAASFFYKGIRKLVPQCDRYRNLHCDDLEK
jgi:hypothetical protein